MELIRKVQMGMGAAVVVVAAGGGLAAASGESEVASGTWSLDTTGPVSIDGAVTIRTTFNGVPAMSLSCDLTITGTIASPAPSAPPGGVIEVEFAAPEVISSSDPGDPEYGKCTDTYTEDFDDVTTSGQPWMVEITVPTEVGPSPWQGSIDEVLRMPAGAAELNNPLVPNCTLEGPSIPTGVKGVYDSATGNLQGTLQQNFPVGKTGVCTVGNPARIVEASFTVDPAYDLVYTP